MKKVHFFNGLNFMWVPNNHYLNHGVQVGVPLDPRYDRAFKLSGKEFNRIEEIVPKLGYGKYGTYENSYVATLRTGFCNPNIVDLMYKQIKDCLLDFIIHSHKAFCIVNLIVTPIVH